MNVIKTIKLWVPVVAWAAFIFYLSNIPGLKTNYEYDFILRKIAHVTDYLILTFFLYRALKGSFNLNYRYLFIYSAVLSVLYAASDEFHQLFVRQRHGCVSDVLIDSIGVFVFYILLRIYVSVRPIHL